MCLPGIFFCKGKTARGWGLRGVINCTSFKIGALQCEFLSLAVVGKYVSISNILKVAFSLYQYFI